jgi:ethanolamine utilization microcompartment shell protein EutL
MPKSEKSLREQLLDARASVQRQIEILEAGPLIGAWGGGTDFEHAKAELEVALQEIDNSLAQLKADDADNTGA